MKRKSAAIDASSLPVASLDLSRPAAEQIASALKSAVLNMQIAPGAMISENEVGQLFGASRTPVREAFAQLRDDGLVVTWPSRGTYVSKLSEHQIRGAQFLREALEVAVVDRLCSEGISDRALAALEDNRIGAHRAMGYVKEAFPEEKIKLIPGVAAIGHVRYPTRGSSILENTQPHIIETLSGPIYAIASNGDLANWSTGAPDAIPAVGGAMDLVAGVKTTFIITQHCTKKGEAKLVDRCSYPLTGQAVVHRIYTDLAVIDVTPKGFKVVELAPGVSFDYVQQRTDASLY